MWKKSLHEIQEQQKGKKLYMKVNPDMIVLARESRGLKQGDLASLLSITQGAISRMEAGLLSVSDVILKLLSEYLNYPENFFFLDERIYGTGISGLGIVYHRQRKNIPIKVIAAIQAQMNIRKIHVSRLIRHAEIESPYEIPHYDVDEYNGKIQEIARAVRAVWQLPQGPVKNLTEAIENAGGIVIKCDFGTIKIDALSQRFPGLPPLFFINSKSPGDRLRFTLAHELGHIVMHSMANPNMEDEADLFASEFLIPSNEIKPLFDTVNLTVLANLKAYWKVSMASLLMKAYALEKIRHETYIYLWKEMSKAGYRRREPVNIPIEEPTALNKLLSICRNKLKYTTAEICNLMALNEEEARLMYFQESNVPYLNIVK
jgi:Zn-dependent peptidase ImmA (M78 family)/transcriptional regulator with XRE-family HTH domain